MNQLFIISNLKRCKLNVVILHEITIPIDIVIEKKQVRR